MKKVHTFASADALARFVKRTPGKFYVDVSGDHDGFLFAVEKAGLIAEWSGRKEEEAPFVVVSGPWSHRLEKHSYVVPDDDITHHS